MSNWSDVLTTACRGIIFRVCQRQEVFQLCGGPRADAAGGGCGAFAIVRVFVAVRGGVVDCA